MMISMGLTFGLRITVSIVLIGFNCFKFISPTVIKRTLINSFLLRKRNSYSPCLSFLYSKLYFSTCSLIFFIVGRSR